MEDILESLRRIISRWVETSTPLSSDASPGDTILTVNSSNRFQAGDEVMLEGPLDGEPNLVIERIIDDTHISLATPVYNRWRVGESSILRKLINGMFVEGIYLGNPEVIPTYPAITVNALSKSSEWLTLDSTKEQFQVEVSIFVEERTHEDGYRFIMQMAKAIDDGLRRNLTPLINDYDISAIIAPIIKGDRYIKVADSSIFNTSITDTNSGFPRDTDARVILEDRFESTENRIYDIIDETTVKLIIPACKDYELQYNPVAINPKRFIFNSWPKNIEYGKTSKGSLLQSAVISWFAEEERIAHVERNDPHLK